MVPKVAAKGCEHKIKSPSFDELQVFRRNTRFLDSIWFWAVTLSRLGWSRTRAHMQCVRAGAVETLLSILPFFLTTAPEGIAFGAHVGDNV